MAVPLCIPTSNAWKLLLPHIDTSIGGVSVLDFAPSTVSYCLFNVYFLPQKNFNLHNSRNRDMRRALFSCWNSIPCSKLIVETPPWPSVKGKKWLISCTVILPFHTLTPIPQFSVALESNMTDGFKNSRIPFMGKSQQNYMRHWNLTQVYSSFHVHVLLPKENVNSPAGWLGPFCLMHRERKMVIFASWLLISPFLHPIASPPRFFFPFNPQVLSRNVIKVIRISDMRCYIKVLHLPPLLLKPHWNSINT